jgi:hypothetical protein
LDSPPKKGPGVAYESEDPPDTTPTTTPVINPSYSKKTSARAIYKAARKGKYKLLSVGLASEMDSEIKGGFVKPPQQHSKYYLGTVGGFLGLL